MTNGTSEKLKEVPGVFSQRGNLGRLRGEHQRRLSLDGLRRTLFETSGHQAERNCGTCDVKRVMFIKELVVAGCYGTSDLL